MRCVALAFLVLVLGSGTAGAQEQECQADVKAHCKDADGATVFTCVQANEAKFSEPCKKKLTDSKAALAELRTACQNDVKTHCAAGKVGDGTLGQCLKTNEGKIGSGCKTAYAKLKAGNALPASLKGKKGLPKLGK